MAATTEFERFLVAFPDYRATSALDELRAADYARLDATATCISTTPAAACTPTSQVRAHARLLSGRRLRQPALGQPASTAATTLVERHAARGARASSTPPRDYTAVFTPNATGALKLVGEAYPFAPGSRAAADLRQPQLGQRHPRVRRARKGAAVEYAPLTLPELRIDRATRWRDCWRRRDRRARNLFAFPAQSNFSGVKHPLELVDEAHAAGWDVLLDAAAFVPTNRLDLDAVQPDFVAISFYKMFGYPTGVGCLLVRSAMRSRGCAGRGSPAAR